ncbi:glycosyltransferase [bacterium]|nr:glycosyltransferase [bacterium]
MELSIIIPVFNEEKYLEDALMSICSQNVSFDYEVIVSDAGSKDNSLKIARRYTNLVVHSLSKAVGAVRNYGAKSAKGKYLLFVDADTILPQGYLQKAYKVFASNKDLSAFCGWFRFKEREPKLLFSEVVANFYFVIKDKIGQPTLPGCCGIAIRKEIFEEVGGFPVYFLEDTEFSSILRKIHKIRYLCNLHAVTSGRRIIKMGLLNTIRYYMWPKTGEFEKDYVSCP